MVEIAQELEAYLHRYTNFLKLSSLPICFWHLIDFFVYTNRQDLMLVTVFAILISRDLVPVKRSIYLTSRMLECQVDGCSVLTTLKSKPQAVILKVGVEQHFTRVLFRRGVGNQG